LLSSVRLLAPAGLEGLIRKEAVFLWCFSVVQQILPMSEVMILSMI
jgi:hypothetical protein